MDCWPLLCPNLNCEYTAISEGECCPHCVSDPCLADNITYDIRKTCLDGYGITRLSGAVWTMVGSPCTTCKCKVRWAWGNGNGNACCCIKSGSLSGLGSSCSDLGEVNETRGKKPTENPRLLCFAGWKTPNFVLVENVERRYVVIS